MVHKPLAIIGFMGCGKSTVGRMVANELQVPFTDLDSETENLSGCRVPKLFETQGEWALRRYESLALYKAAPGGGVLATSGGCILMLQNRKLLREAYTTVFLDAPFNVILPRITGTGRPLLKSMSKEELQRMCELRRPLYAECADVILNGAKPVDELVNEIIDLYYS